MFSARLKKGALAVAMACLAMSTPAALAERSERGGDSRLQAAQQLIQGACTQPDASTLRAILPVATDHGSQATGVVFDRNRVLTAAHAVSGGGQFFVKIGEAYRQADLVGVDESRDLAVLSVDTQGIEPLHIAGFDPVEYQPVWAVGYPRAQAIMTSTGVLQDYHEGSLHASASIDSGQSGGGLLACSNGSWQMLGMLRGFGAYLDGDSYIKIQNHSVSVAAATIQQFLRTTY